MTPSDAAVLGPNGSSNNFLKSLRERKRTCADILQRKNLGDMADQLEAALRALLDDTTTDNMIRLNGIWTRARWLLDRTDDAGPSGGGGRARPGVQTPLPENEMRIAA